MVLEPRDKEQNPSLRGALLGASPQACEKLKPRSRPKLEPGSPASQPRAQGHQETVTAPVGGGGGASGGVTPNVSASWKHSQSSSGSLTDQPGG